MLYWSLAFFVVAIIAGVFGFFGIASAAEGIAKILFFLFAVLFVFSLITGLRGRGGTRLGVAGSAGRRTPANHPASAALARGSGRPALPARPTQGSRQGTGGSGGSGTAVLKAAGRMLSPCADTAAGAARHALPISDFASRRLLTRAQRAQGHFCGCPARFPAIARRLRGERSWHGRCLILVTEPACRSTESPASKR
jgi:uncharacterized membrane protein YtjA (UPF0391 family)